MIDADDEASAAIIQTALKDLAHWLGMTPEDYLMASPATRRVLVRHGQ